MPKRALVFVVPVTVVLAVWTTGLLAGAAAGRPQSKIKHYPGSNPDLPFSAAVEVGDTLYLAGTLGLDPQTGRPPASAREEARRVLDGIQDKLKAAGLTMDDLVSVQVFCADVALYDDFNAVYRTYFKERFPARAFVGSGALLRGARFEVQGIAVRR